VTIKVQLFCRQMPVKHGSVDNVQSSRGFRSQFWLTECALKSTPVACSGKLELRADARKHKKEAEGK